MAVHKSDQITNLDATPRQQIKTNEWNGRVRVAYWSFATPAGTVAVNDTIELVKLPKGARILHGRAFWEAMSSGAGDASVQIGVSGTAGKYLGTTSVDAAGSAVFADTVALNSGEELAADTTIIATALTEAWAAGKKFNGYVLYVVD